jgi:alpha-D-ribose 1-methylphosphonate 5-phosphate C-P lyase
VSRHRQPTPLCECGSPVEFCQCGELRCYLCDPIADDLGDSRWDCDDWFFCETPIVRDTKGGDVHARSHVGLAQP